MSRLDVRIACDGLPDGALVYEYTGREAISELFEFELLVVCPGEQPDAEALVGASASLVFTVDDVEVRHLHGIVAECVDLLDSETEHAHYRMRLVPRLWRSGLVKLIDIYLDQSVPDLVKQKLELVSLGAPEDAAIRLNANYPAREFVVQYDETDLAFISRLCEHLGVFYFFEHGDERERVVFGDGNEAFASIGESGEATFHPRGERRGVFELRATTRIIPATYVQRDFNYRTPTVDLTGNAQLPEGEGGVYEYGAHVKTPEEAEKLARIRSEEQLARKRVFEGRSVIPTFSAGGRVMRREHPFGDLDLLVTEVRHRGRQGTHGGLASESSYENEFRAIRADVAYRPARVTPRPFVKGLLTGLVEGQEGSEYADVDDQGRYRVRFLFDTAAPGERQASRAIRMMQPHAGPGYGMHFPLRRGVEVLIAFVNGDPDRPIIAGTVPNPLTASPVSSDNKERNIIRTGAGNEINIDDTKGAERIKLSTPRRGATLQLGQPNASEDGAVIQSMTNVTSAASGTTNVLSSWGNSWSTWANTWGNHVTTVAGKVMWVDALNYTAAEIDSGLAMVSTTMNSTIGYIQQHDADLEEKVVAKRKDRFAKLDDANEAISDRAADPTLNPAQQAKLSDLKAKIAAYQTAKSALETAESDLADLEAKKEAAEASGDTPTVKALDAQIAAKKTEIKADQGALATAKDAQTAAETAAKADPGGDDLTKKLDAYDKADKSYDDAVSDHASFHDAHMKSGTATANAGETAKGIDAARGVLALTTPLMSAYTTLYGTGLQGYAAASANILWEEAKNQRDGRVNLLKIGTKPPGMMSKILSTDLSKTPVRDQLTPHTGAAYGPISRLAWGIDGAMLVPGGGGGLLNAVASKKGVAMALMATALGPVAPFVLPYIAKSAAFNEARNIQGSEDKAVLYGKTSVLVSGQDSTTVSTAGRMLVTSDAQTVVHSRGRTELVGVEEVYLASAKTVDILTRGDLLMRAYDGSGGTDMTQDKLQTKVHIEKTAASIETFDPQGKPFSVVALDEQEIGLFAYHRNAASEIHAWAIDANDDLGASLELKSDKTAQLLAGAFGLRADGTAQWAKVGNGQWELAVASDGASLGTAGAGELEIKAGSTKLKGAALELGSAQGTITVVASTLNLGPCGIQSDNLVVKDEVNAKVIQLKSEIQAAQSKAEASAKQAEQAQKAAVAGIIGARKAKQAAAEAKAKANDAQRVAHNAKVTADAAKEKAEALV